MLANVFSSFASDRYACTVIVYPATNPNFKKDRKYGLDCLASKALFFFVFPQRVNSKLTRFSLPSGGEIDLRNNQTHQKI